MESGADQSRQPAPIIKGPDYNEVPSVLPTAGHPAVTVSKPNRVLQITTDSICHLDFRNIPASSGDRTVLLRDGKYEQEEKLEQETVELKQVNCFDKGAHALIVLDWTGCGANCHGVGVVQLLELRSNRPVVVQEFSFDENALGTEAKFDEKRLTLTIVGRSDDDSADCCPKNLDVVTYRWQERAFVQDQFKRIPAPTGKTDAEAPAEDASGISETQEVATIDTLLRFPELYKHRRIQLAGWEHALVETSKSADIDSHSLPDDCVYLLNFPGGIGCAAAVPRELLSPFGAANEENIELTCTVEVVKPVGILLTHCDLSPSDYWKMRKREYELEKHESQSNN